MDEIDKGRSRRLNRSLLRSSKRSKNMGSSLVTDKNDNVLPLTNNVCQSSYSAANSTYCGYTLETITRAVESTIEIRVTG